ncbi:glycogen debranching protein GlgX [Chitinibacter sp. GC72]|uniref:glycogen debranching protein GlgX n=1 Tax=Chitinibacter sp. GC72 TaxID=1526917 RepID=UPI0012FBE4FD|nr:glycogen debranching protein GlgX [Chitinibacter sp. GC72]
MVQFATQAGRPHPLGATPCDEGVNFSLYSQDATHIELLLFARPDDQEPSQTIVLNPESNRSFFFWHVLVEGLKPGWHYAYRVDGPQQPEQGLRFNPAKVLLDPYAKGISNLLWDRAAACGDGDNLHHAMRCEVVDTRDYDWEGDKPLGRRMADSVIYELHVRGFTASSDLPKAGTFRALIEKIPYLQELGVTAVELLPVFDFDETEVLRVLPDGSSLKNFWGYSTVGYFAPENSFCASAHEGAHINELRDLVKALHAADIEIILDVVFNHTNEGNHLGPTLHFKGIDNRTYYILVDGQPQYYMDYTGCGNTVNSNHPITDKFIQDCLEYWVREFHIDGFRFDEGSILSRDESGRPMRHPPVLWNLELSETFCDTKLIAEAWDAAGLYQIGSFPGMRWAEWNGRYRDDVRRFVRGDPGLVGAVATRIAGSADIYQWNGRGPENSVNFIACHDGFTLMDLVSYNGKHNDCNGEGNRDGIDDNLSWNCGQEGPCEDPGVIALRKRQIKNFAAILLLSQGVPMLMAGDEFGRSQQGNNNAYCQDNAISWLDWSLLDANRDLFKFVKGMIALRRRCSQLRRWDYFEGGINARGVAQIAWHGCMLNAPGWSDPDCQVLAFTLGALDDKEPDLHIMLNMADQALGFQIPELNGRHWHRYADSAIAGEAAMDMQAGTVIEDAEYLVSGRSVVVLLSK